MTHVLLPALALAMAPPHLVLIVGDDMGFNDIGYSDPTVPTPTMDALARDGVRMSSLYTWNWCAPSRGSLLTGRYVPNHGYEEGGDGPEGDGTVNGLPLEFELMPEALKRAANYSTHMAGKWHQGYATSQHLPESRGFDSYLGYLTGAEDYYTHVKSPVSACPDTRDLWRAGGPGLPPAVGPGGPVPFNDTSVWSHTPGASGMAQYTTRYSTKLFADHLVRTIEAHPNGTSAPPMFIYAPFQGVHGPLEVDKEYFDRVLAHDRARGFNRAARLEETCLWDTYQKKGGKSFECDPSGPHGTNCACNRLLVRAQMAALDDAVANITEAMRRRGLYDNSVMIVLGDNGGPTFDGHSNTPMRGGKLNFFEGGVRPAAFVHSPLLAPGGGSLRGGWFNGSAHESDIFATFFSLAMRGSNNARLEGLDGIDGVNLWNALSNVSVSAPRDEVLIADHVLRVGQFKLMTGAGNESWTRGLLRDCMLGTGGGWLSPPLNNTNICQLDVYTRDPGKDSAKAGTELCCNASEYDGCQPVTSDVDRWLCSEPCSTAHPCLFDLVADPQERINIAAQQPDRVTAMLARLQQLSKSFYPASASTLHDKNYPSAFCAAVAARGGFLGPWLDPVVPTPAPAPTPPTPAPPCPQPCFDRCIAMYGGTIYKSNAYRCASGCAGMGDGNVIKPDKFCAMDPTKRYDKCTSDCKEKDTEQKQTECAYGCGYWQD